MDVLRRELRVREGRDSEPSAVMVDCQVTKGGRGGPSFHENHGKYRLCGAKKTIAIDYLGLPVGATVHGARRHDVRAARELLDELLPNHPRVADVLGDRGFRGLAGPIARDHGVTVEIKHRDRLPGEFTPARPLWRVEDAFASVRTMASAGTVVRSNAGVGDRVGAPRLCRVDAHHAVTATWATRL